MVTIRDNRDYIRVLIYSSYTTITGWVVLLMNTDGFPDPQKDQKIRSPRTIRGELYKDYIGAIMGLYRGSNF